MHPMPQNERRPDLPLAELREKIQGIGPATILFSQLMDMAFVISEV